MSRSQTRSLLSAALVAMLFAATGCQQLDGRTRVRKGNAMFKEADYKGAVVEYEAALKEVQSPTIHYNLALAEAKLFKPGTETPENKALGDKIATDFNAWLVANPADTATRDLMTQVWLDSGDYDKALAYWTEQLKATPNNGEIMGKLAGINLKANRWRDSMNWYEKVAIAANDTTAKVLAYQSIGNVAWAKLNSNTLNAPDRVEAADRGIGALEMAADLSPKNLKNHGLIASIYNFRSLAHGASWAASIDRATAQDQRRQQSVLAEEAKKAAGVEAPAQPAGTPPAAGSGSGAGSATATTTTPTPNPSPAKAGG